MGSRNDEDGFYDPEIKAVFDDAENDQTYGDDLAGIEADFEMDFIQTGENE